MNLSQIVYERRNSGSVAVKCGETELTYRRLWKCIKHNSRKLREVKADKMGLFIKNSAEYIVAYFSIMLSGKAVVLIPVSFSGNEIQKMLTDLAITDVCVSSVNEALSNCTQHVVELITSDCEENETAEAPENVDDEIALIMSTSGTTGVSKYVPFTHEQLMAAVSSVARFTEIKALKDTLILLPMTSAYCNTMQMLQALYGGLEIIIYDGKINPKRITELIQQNSVTSILITFTLLRLLGEYWKLRKCNVSSLKLITCGGEVSDPEGIRTLRKMLPGCYIVLGYGLTEACAAVSVQTVETYNIDDFSAGIPFDSMKIKIIDEEGKEQLDSAEGEIAVTSPYTAQKYYGCNTPITENGWLKTGDIGFIDEKGALHITGRKKNMIISGGSNVNAEEVETVLMKHGNVKEVRVYGEKDTVTGETVVAEIVVKDRASFSQIEMTAFCRQWLSDYKIPGKMLLVDAIDKNSMGKIVRK